MKKPVQAVEENKVWLSIPVDVGRYDSSGQPTRDIGVGERYRAPLRATLRLSVGQNVRRRADEDKAQENCERPSGNAWQCHAKSNDLENKRRLNSEPPVWSGY